MLPTLAVILWAYGMYALISTVFRTQGGYLRSRSRGARWLARPAGRRYRRGGFGLGLLLPQSFDNQDHGLKLAGFLGTVWAEGWPDKVEGRVEYPPVKDHGPGD